ncbi:MAG: phenylacetate-CoA oxygenase subunit PaaC [Chitinophagales bacterium]|nr:phenylacetate-CoA oxygenase subunit PaaC [Chitinophagales bacterium]MBP9180417.1 phenylacetate-CoA oxygenase subunit PaaC [Bacteroidia bacterium]MBP9724565.1 phenylacetate-CoA oxygenase subunit PaaC [Bacteroidia bacterium]
MNHVKELLYKMADDLLIIGHRNSEWTGLGPILEEDIAFSSMAQDKIGQSQALFQLLHELGEQEPDTVAFTRQANQFHNCQLVELPNGDYDFSTIRHFLYDVADQLRFEMLANSSYEPLAKVSRKIKGELKYHVFHANTWVTKLGAATEESHARMQTSLNEAWNYALGIFEESEFEQQLISEKIFEGEAALKARWLETIQPVLAKASLKIPEEKTWEPKLGGRKGYHTEHLDPLVEEMAEVFRIDPGAEW